MRTLQNYRDIYREIADNLGLQGDSVELLVQLLSQASYISEVENISYTQEASLERASLINSKIQHCMNEMYSVFRGSCPRVILNFKPTKYFSLNVFDKIVTSNNFNVYYLGYLPQTPEQSEDYAGRVAVEEGFVYGPTTIPPAIGEETYTIIGLIAKETAQEEWTIDKNNTYYVDTEASGLSNDMWVKINGSFWASTRLFSEHIVDSKVFDLTLPSFSSRLYVADLFRETMDRSRVTTETNLGLEAFYFKYSTLDSYNNAELRKINMKGAVAVPFTTDFLTSRCYEETEPGLILLPERKRDGLETIHYKANRDRYVNSVLRSNSDIGTVLEEMYPDKIVSGGTTYEFKAVDGGSNLLNIYYIPKAGQNLLSTSEIENFISEKKAYYITDTINVYKGYQYTAIFNIVLELYKNEDVNEEVAGILDKYGNKFGVELAGADIQEEIKSLISKISNVKQIKDFKVSFTDESGKDVKEQMEGTDIKNVYFKVNYVIDSTIQSKVI